MSGSEASSIMNKNTQALHYINKNATWLVFKHKLRCFQIQTVPVTWRKNINYCIWGLSWELHPSSLSRTKSLAYQKLPRLSVSLSSRQCIFSTERGKQEKEKFIKQPSVPYATPLVFSAQFLLPKLTATLSPRQLYIDAHFASLVFHLYTINVSKNLLLACWLFAASVWKSKL